MSNALLRASHRRSRDPLAGLSPTMRAALAAVRDGRLGERDHGRAIDIRTLQALAARALIRTRIGRDGRARGFGLTRAGAAALAEIGRRPAARRRLIEEKPARALSAL